MEMLLMLIQSNDIGRVHPLTSPVLGNCYRLYCTFYVNMTSTPKISTLCQNIECGELQQSQPQFVSCELKLKFCK